MTEMVNDHTPTEKLPDTPITTREEPSLSVSYTKDGFIFTIHTPLRNLKRDQAKLLECIHAAGGLPTSQPAPQPAAKAAPAHPPRPAKKPTPSEPYYDTDGTRLCPRHMKPLRVGRWGYDYCPEQESDPTQATSKGYCSLHFPSVGGQEEEDDIPF